MSASGVKDRLKRAYPVQLTCVASYAFVYGALLMITPFISLTYKNVFGEALYALLFAGFVAVFIEGLLIRELSVKPLWMKVYVAFFAVMLVTAAVNYRYGVVGNLKAAVFQLTAFTTCSVTALLLAQQGKLSSFVRRLFYIVLALWTVACAVSLIEFVVQYSNVIEFSPTELRRQGFVDGRLFGVFQDPNFGAVTVVVLYAIAFYYYATNQIRHGKALTVALVICFFYLVGAASRTANLCILACGVIGVCALRYRIKHSVNPKGRRVLISDSVQLTVSAIVVVVAVGSAMPYYASFVRTTFDLPWASMGSSARLDTRLDNLSNNRTSIWMGYIECSDPITAVIGRGYRTYRDEVVDQYPDSYIAKTKYEAHNGFVLLYESSGLVGVALWGLFAFVVLKLAICRARTSRGSPCDVICSLCLLAIVIIMGCFFTAMWFVNDFYTYLFAAIIGYLCWKLEPESLGNPFRRLKEARVAADTATDR